MDISSILFYSLVITFLLSLLFAVLNDEMHEVFYFVLDTLTNQFQAISELGRR